VTRRFRRLVALVVGLALVGAQGIAVAQTAPLISIPFSLTSTGAGPVLALNGQSTCSLVLDNAGTGLTLVPQATSAQFPNAGSQWATASTIGSGSISTFGTYVGNVAGTGLTGFRFVITALSSGTVSGTETCSPALGLGSSSGASNVNLTQVGGAAIALGQATKSASLPVTIASDQGGLATSCTAATCSVNEGQLGGTNIGAPSAAGVSATGNIQGIQGVTGGLAVPVSGTFFQTTQPVSGTVTMNAGTGTMAVSCATAGTCPVNATQTGTWTNTVTQATASNLNAAVVGVGTAGTPAGGVVSIQGVGSGTAVPVSGTVTMNAGTGTMAVSCATAATCPTNATLQSGSTTAVTQATGTNLHAVLDTTSTTAVTQATASNLNAAVVGVGTAGTPSGGVLSVQGVASGTAQPVSCSAGSACPVNATLQAGSAIVGKVGIDQTTPGTTNLVQIPIIGLGAIANVPTTGTPTTPVLIGSPPSGYVGVEIYLTQGATAASVSYLVATSGSCPSSPASSTIRTVTGPTSSPDIGPVQINLTSPANVCLSATAGTVTPQFRYI
jgi:hypothetical protein